MPIFVGFIDTKTRVVIKGETLKEAMAAAGYLPLNQQLSGGRLVGQLTTGQRFTFRLAPSDPKFANPVEVAANKVNRRRRIL